MARRGSSGWAGSSRSEFGSLVEGPDPARPGPPTAAAGRTWNRACSSNSRNGSISLPLAYARDGLFMLSLWFWVRANRRRIDIPHVHETHWIAGFAGWLGRRYSIPVAAKIASIPPFCYISKTIPLRTRWTAEQKHVHFIALNPPAQAALLEAGIPPGQIHVIPNGVTLPETAAAPAGNRNVLFIGNFSQGRLKAFDILFAAWKRVQDHLHRHSLPPAKLVMAGGGDAEPWRRMVTGEGMSDSVEFLGYTPEPEKQILRAACLVLPSRIEGMSNALLEAMSFGVPAIVSDIPANTCLVTDHVNGRVVRVEDSEALAAAILGLLADEAMRAALGSAARRTVETQYEIRAVATRLAGLYRELAPRPPELK
ncbi:MAG: glycosyltransferase [Kiritimatiellia bacterium]